MPVSKRTANDRGQPAGPLLFEEYAEGVERGHAKFMAQYKKSLPTDKQQLFERYRLDDHAIKAGGVGSVDTRCFLALFLADEDDPLFLQVKEAR